MIKYYKDYIIKQFFDTNNQLFAQLNYAKKFYTKYAKHSHDTLCISIIKTGQIQIEFHNQTPHLLQPNQLVVFNPHQVHKTQHTHIKTYDYFTLHIHKQWLDKISNDIFFQNNIISNKQYYENFLQLCENLKYGQYTNAEEKIYDFFTNFVSQYASKQKQQIQTNEILTTIKTYILNNIQEQLTLDDIANEIGYSKEYIIRIFKKEFGLTPHAFLMNEKVNYAKNLIDKSKQLNLSNLALEIGFYDQSHFTRFFKKSFAITPYQYKQ